ncbi:MAG: DUF484 family protein [Gammaproteobacteria bacterium]|nr:DUF484 family protein [Gammaproteobacteria bacterium]
MSIQTKGEMSEKLNAKDIDAYLRRHPNFFENHAHLLMELKIPHVDTGNAISLIEYQVGLLRRQNGKLQKQLDDLLQIARDNDRLSKCIYKLTLGLMGAQNLPDVFNLLDESLRKDFSADATCIRILAQPKNAKFASRVEFAANAGELSQQFGRQLKDGKPICGRAKQAQKQYLFGDTAEKVASLAFVPLRLDDSAGFIAIGSYDEKRFHSGMGTLFLAQLGKVSSKTMVRFLKSEA